MIVVAFEVTLKPGPGQRYFDLAAELRPELDKIDGFISVERFQSMASPGKYVSLSFWRDEAAVARWRGHSGHGLAQALGKREIFADFRISVGQVIRQYSLADRAGAAEGHG
jgi:heme-degrading monooxygenase HmoA